MFVQGAAKPTVYRQVYASFYHHFPARARLGCPLSGESETDVSIMADLDNTRANHVVLLGAGCCKGSQRLFPKYRDCAYFFHR